MAIFLIKNNDSVTIDRFITFDKAKDAAIEFKKETGENCYIEKIELVWTTQTLDEAIGEK